MDSTEHIRREMVEEINSRIESTDKDMERQRLEAEYGKVWDTQELSHDFEVIGFMVPFCVVKNRVTEKKGSMEFQHYLRFYFNFVED